MSYGVVRGEPTAAQRYLDTLLDGVLHEQGVRPEPPRRARVTLAQVLHYCLKRQPGGTFMTNGATGEVITNGQLLQRAVPLARALTAQGMKGSNIMLMMRNHQHMTAVYFGSLFAGVKSFMMDPNSTAYEVKHFLNLMEPEIVFCDREHYDILKKAFNGLSPKLVVGDEPGALEDFFEGFSEHIDSYQVAETLPDDVVMYLPTSGSSGLPKAAMLTNKGLVIQLPSSWFEYCKFPRPTDTVMILTTVQWTTFTMMMTSSVAFGIPVLMSPNLVTEEHVCDIMEKYKPTWAFTSPAFASELVTVVTPEQMSSIETLMLLGAPPSAEVMASLKEKLPKTALLGDGYGTTETQGSMLLPGRNTPMGSNGRMLNIFQYKILNDNGHELGPNQVGELHVKSDCLVKGYYKNEKTTKETFTPSGWYITGDMFRMDENEQFSFVVRKKFSFKYKGHQVAPEEVERIIGSVPGVHDCVVCGKDNGPTAAVVLQPNTTTSRDDIHQQVNSSLQPHKRLHGGIAFVDSLPHTNTGKLKRQECSQLLDDLVKRGLCH